MRLPLGAQQVRSPVSLWSLMTGSSPTCAGKNWSSFSELRKSSPFVVLLLGAAFLAGLIDIRPLERESAPAARGTDS